MSTDVLMPQMGESVTEGTIVRWIKHVGDNVDKDEPQQWLRSLRAFANRRRGDAMLLGEVNLGLNELASYFGEHGDELHMQLSFLINEHLWLALAREQAEPLETVIRELPAVPPDSGWAVFLRNHDELTLDKLTVPQRNDVFAAFGPDEGMQLYGHGLYGSDDPGHSRRP